MSEHLPANKLDTTLEPVTRASALPFSMQPKNLGEAITYATMISKSTLCPEAFRGKPGDIMIVMQMAHELGIPFFQSLQRICVINGRPSIWGELGIAIIQGSPNFEYLVDEFDEKTMTATCKVKRRGRPERVASFSWDDAVKAGLDKKDTYQKYPKDMLTWKARWRAMKPEFADRFAGIEIVEEARDMPPVQQASAPIQMPRAINSTIEQAIPQTIAQSSTIEQPRPEAEPLSDWAREFATFAPEPEAAPAAPAPEDSRLFVLSGAKDAPGDKRKSPRWTIDLSDGRKVYTWSQDEFDKAMTFCEGKMPVEAVVEPHADTGHLVLKSIKAA